MCFNGRALPRLLFTPFSRAFRRSTLPPTPSQHRVASMPTTRRRRARGIEEFAAIFPLQASSVVLNKGYNTEGQPGWLCPSPFSGDATASPLDWRPHPLLRTPRSTQGPSWKLYAVLPCEGTERNASNPSSPTAPPASRVGVATGGGSQGRTGMGEGKHIYYACKASRQATAAPAWR